MYLTEISKWVPWQWDPLLWFPCTWSVLTITLCAQHCAPLSVNTEDRKAGQLGTSCVPWALSVNMKRRLWVPKPSTYYKCIEDSWVHGGGRISLKEHSRPMRPRPRVHPWGAKGLAAEPHCGPTSVSWQPNWSSPLEGKFEDSMYFSRVPLE